MKIKDKFYSRGVIYATIYDHEEKPSDMSSIDIIAHSLEEAMKYNQTTPHELARWLVTSSFKHIKNRRARFNSILRAGDDTGARLVPKIVNLITKVVAFYKQETDSSSRELYYAILGMVAVFMTILYPFSVENEHNSYQVDGVSLWEYMARYCSENLGLSLDDAGLLLSAV